MKKFILAFAIFFVSISAHAQSITVEPEYLGDDYDRNKHFGKWIDEDGDGISTRHEVLIEESLVPVKLSEDGTKVISGLWYCPFTGKSFLTPLRGTYAHLQIDHIVPLKEAWQSGAKEWTRDKRVAFANDMNATGHLIAVDGPTNGKKGFKDPAEWMPPNESFHCAYVVLWMSIKQKWGLSMDQAEYDFIKETIQNCDKS